MELNRYISRMVPKKVPMIAPARAPLVYWPLQEVVCDEGFAPTVWIVWRAMRMGLGGWERVVVGA